jgi:hypothetical protein
MIAFLALSRQLHVVVVIALHSRESTKVGTSGNVNVTGFTDALVYSIRAQALARAIVRLFSRTTLFDCPEGRALRHQPTVHAAIDSKASTAQDDARNAARNMVVVKFTCVSTRLCSLTR